MCALRQTARVGDASTRWLPLLWQAWAAGCLALTLPQTARGGDPSTPRGLRAHTFLEPLVHMLLGLGCLCFAFGRLCHVRGPLPCWDVLVNVDAWLALLSCAGVCHRTLALCHGHPLTTMRIVQTDYCLRAVY